MDRVKIYKATFSEKIERAATTVSFRFRCPQKPEFIPGQFLQVIFDEADLNNKELNKYLSFSSPPQRDHIEITKRLSQSRFSDKLKSLKTNDEILIKAPFGNCVFKDEYKKIVFLIGGIGITPVISILGYIVDRKLNTDVKLFYSNRTEEEIAFKKELDAWQAANCNVRIIYTVTDCQPNPLAGAPRTLSMDEWRMGTSPHRGGQKKWPTGNALWGSRESTCVFGRIDKGLLINNLQDYKERVAFIFGPPKMVEAMQDLLLTAGSPRENIKTEHFIGY